MFWFLSESKTENYTVEFKQIFNFWTKYQDSGAGCVNNIYNLETSKSLENIIKKFKQNNNFHLIEPNIITLDIKIKHPYIQYSNNELNINFKIAHEFVKEDNELNKKPFIQWKYEKIDNHKFPLLNKKNYDYWHENIKFYIYQINPNKLFVIEQNTEIFKEYYLEKIC